VADLKVAIVGLGAAAALVLPSFKEVEGVRLVSAVDTRPEARQQFEQSHGLPAFESIAAMCDAVDLDAVWIETPNHLHCEHALAALERGKHVICAKPLGVTMAECEAMIAAARRAGVQLLQGHSKVMDTPVQAIRNVIASGELGKVIQINIWLFNDWLQRPRLADELDPNVGGGIVLRQGPHQIDIVRYIAGAPARSVRAMTGSWDPHFQTEGNYTALITFEGGAAATVSLNGYGYFNSTELTWGYGVTGRPKDQASRREPAPRRTGALDPSEKYGAAAKTAPAFAMRHGTGMPFFGLTVVSCERGVIRQSPEGLYVYTDAGCREVMVPPNPGRSAELIELRDAVASEQTAFPDGIWGRDTLEVCLAIRESARLRQTVAIGA